MRWRNVIKVHVTKTALFYDLEVLVLLLILCALLLQ
jgi:hypothetical protein